MSLSTRKLGRVVFVRHGESVWNITDPDRGLVSRFTGWVDVALTDRGRLQAAAAGRCLKMFGVYPDAVFTSNLRRSKDSYEVMKQNDPDMFDVQVANSWRLNERHYGALVGLSKEEAGETMGHNIVMGWRKSWDLAPPENVLNRFEWENAEWTKPITTVTERGQQTLVLVEKNIKMPTTESLRDCAMRVKPLWVNFIAPRIAEGKTILIVAHANSIRSIIKHIDEQTLSVENLKNVSIPSATPLLYCFTTKPPPKVTLQQQQQDNTPDGRSSVTSSNGNSRNQIAPVASISSAKLIIPMGQPSKLGMTGRYLVNREVIKLALESSVTMSTADFMSLRDIPDNKPLQFFDLIDRNISDIIHYSNSGNGSEECLLITDGRGIVLHVNQKFEQLTGFLNEEVKGKSAGFLQGPLTLREQLASLDEKLRTGLPATSTLINYTKKGIPFENKMTIIPIFDWLPTIRGNSCTVRLDEQPKKNNEIFKRQHGSDTVYGPTDSHLSNRETEDMQFSRSSGLYMHPSHFIARYEIKPVKGITPLTDEQISKRDGTVYRPPPVYDAWKS